MSVATEMQVSAAGKRQEATARWAVLLLLIAAVLCFGAVEPGSLFLLQAGAVFIFLLWAAGLWRTLRLQPDWPFMLLASFGVLAFTQFVTGNTAYRYATQQELLSISAYFICFFLARQLFLGHDTRRQAANFLVIFGAILATFAIVQRLQGNGQIYWLRASSTPTFFGPYANKNHYAGLMEMLLPFALMASVRTSAQRSQQVLSAFAACVMVASVVLSGSRSGVAVVMLEALTFALVLLTGSGRRKRLSFLWLAAAAVCGIVFVLWIGGAAFFHEADSLRRPTADASFINRRELAADSFRLFEQRPLLGWGLGSFSTVYPQTASHYSDILVNAAHDDYLQLLVETGVAGFALMITFLACTARVGLRGFARAPTGTVSAALLGCAGLLAHSFTDFNLHIPANAAMFFFLCGLICASGAEELSSRPAVVMVGVRS